MPIAIAPLNVPLKIIRISADPKVKKYLESLGIIKDAEITVLSSINGHVVIALKEGRLALDKDVASTIFVC